MFTAMSLQRGRSIDGPSSLNPYAMKRNNSRAASPTPTAFSAISNYRSTDSHRKDSKAPPPVPNIDYRRISKLHFAELGRYLTNYLEKASANSRSTARSKLTRLTIQQFHELSTDVYDELVRRKNETEVPFLPVREEFHPKRNQARQKLATLLVSRFEDLSSDIYFELARRYPEFKEDPSGRGSAASNYDDYPAPDFSPDSSPHRNDLRTSESADRQSDSGYGSNRRPSGDRHRPSDTDVAGRRSEDSYRRPDDSYLGRDNSFSASLASRRKPSQDTTRRPDEREGGFGRKLSQPTRNASDATSGASQPPAASTTATSAVIIPNKSTMEEEYIDIPYGRERSDSGFGERHGSADDAPESASDYPVSIRSPPAGLGGLAARLKRVGAEDDDDDDLPPGNASGDDPFGKHSRSMGESSRSVAEGVLASRGPVGGRTSVSEDMAKLRSEYEHKAITMQSQISDLQRDLGHATETENLYRESETLVKQLEEELAGLRQRAEDQSASLRALQTELENAKEAREREARQTEEDRGELNKLRDRCNKLEEELGSRHGGDSDATEQLRGDMEGLLSEMNELSRRNDELMNEREADATLIRDLDIQLKEYRRKYESAKTELRSVKATSQLFLQAPNLTEDQLPVSPGGGILDVHVTTFLSAIDSLLTAGRSSAPTRVLTPMKSVVNAVTNILDDVKAFERRPPRDRGELDIEGLALLRERAEATLSNLVAASKTHASSAGMSPVSLLDAAASHVSVTITEIGRMISIRKATKAEMEQQRAYGYAAPNTAVAGFSPSLRTLDEKTGHQRKASQASVSSSRGVVKRFTPESPGSTQIMSLMKADRRRPLSDNSSSEKTNSPPPIFDTQAQTAAAESDDSVQADGSEDAWAELKPYLEAQTESIVYAIQAVLSGVRSPSPSATLSENLTQIITIVSSIVAVCKDNLPPASARHGNEILKELDEHAYKLSEVQSLPEVTKESRQTMAKSSFAIANAMKGLMKL